jgi:hypothetical protein
MEGNPVKLLYAFAFAIFPLAAPAQTLDPSLLTALCHDDYFEDTASQCSTISAGEVLTIEALLERYSAVITRDTNDDITGALLADPEDMPVGSINPPSEIPPAEHAILNCGEICADTAIAQETIASQIVVPETQLERSAESADDVTTTGPTARHIPAVATETVQDNPTVE